MKNNIELIKKQKSKRKIVLGILFFTIAVSWIPVRLVEKNTIFAFDWVYSSFFFLHGISQIIIGFGCSLKYKNLRIL